MDLDLRDCLGRVKIGILAKFHRTDLVIWCHSIGEKKTPSYSQINTVYDFSVSQKALSLCIWNANNVVCPEQQPKFTANSYCPVFCMHMEIDIKSGMKIQCRQPFVSLSNFTIPHWCMPPLLVFEDVSLPYIISSWKDCLRKIILSLALTKLNTDLFHTSSKHRFSTVSMSNFTGKLHVWSQSWSANFSEVTTQFPMMDNSCLINTVMMIKRKRTKDKSTRTISSINLILFSFLL